MAGVKIKRDMTQGGQFALIPASVLYDGQLPATAKLLYGEIYRLSHANGYCYASNRDFMNILQCSEPTVTRLIAKLAEQNHIRVKMIRRYGGEGDITQRRIFCGQELAQKDPPDMTEAQAEGILKNDDTSPQKRLDGPLKNDDLTIKRKINKRNTPISPSEVLREFTAYAGESIELLEALNGFLESRAKKGKPIDTLRAAHILTNKLDKLSGGNLAAKITLLDTATLNGWRSVYPLKAGELPALPDASEEGYDGI